MMGTTVRLSSIESEAQKSAPIPDEKALLRLATFVHSNMGTEREEAANAVLRTMLEKGIAAAMRLISPVRISRMATSVPAHRVREKRLAAARAIRELASDDGVLGIEADELFAFADRVERPARSA